MTDKSLRAEKIDPRTTFPTTQEDFADDPRVFFSRESNTYHIEEDGKEWEFIERASNWIEVIDEAQLAAYNAQYKVEGVNDEVVPLDNEKKRKAADGARAEASKKQKENESRRDGINKAVYVTGLPHDTDEDEIFNVFSKYGLIDESWDTNKPRIKMYYDEKQEFKGEALIVYFKPESVSHVIQMLHGTDFRQGIMVDGNLKIVVADQNFKAQDTKEKAKRKPLTDRERQKIQAKKEEMNKRLNWDSDEEDRYAPQSKTNRWDRLMIIKNMYTVEGLAADPALYLELKDDLREQCELFGKVTNVVIYDGEPDGVATIRFQEVDAAEACVRKMNGRKYDGRTIKASLSNGLEHFKKSNKDGDAEAEEARLEAYRQQISKEDPV